MRLWDYFKENLSLIGDATIASAAFLLICMGILGVFLSITAFFSKTKALATALFALELLLLASSLFSFLVFVSYLNFFDLRKSLKRAKEVYPKAAIIVAGIALISVLQTKIVELSPYLAIFLEILSIYLLVMLFSSIPLLIANKSPSRKNFWKYLSVLSLTFLLLHLSIKFPLLLPFLLPYAFLIYSRVPELDRES